MSTEISSHLQGARGFVQHGCALSATFPQFVSPITMQTTWGLCVTPSNRLSSGLSVFSSGFLKTQVYGSTLLLHSQMLLTKGSSSCLTAELC